MENFNVCIVGSGFAAYSSAITLAEKGIKTVLIKQNKKKTTKNYFGETLSTSVSPSLFDIGMQDPFKKIFMPQIENSISSWGSDIIERKSRLINPSGFGWIFNREEFEDSLCNRLNKTTAKILSGDIASISKKKDYWQIKIENDIEMVSIMSETIIIAVGRDKLTFLPLPKKISVDKLVCCIVAFKAKSNHFDKSIYVDSSKHGWFYSTMNNNGDRIINYFTDGDLLASKIEQTHIEFLKNEISYLPSLSGVVSPSDLDKIDFYKVVSANTTFRTSKFAERLLFCGDAAQTFDPLSSQGITNAFKDGINLANAILDYYKGNEKAFGEYEKARRNNFVEYLKTRHRVYSNEVRWKNNLFWERRHNIEYIKSFLKKVELK